MLKRIFAILLLPLALSSATYASTLSRGIDVLRTQSSYTVSVAPMKTHTFTVEEFSDCIGCDFDEIFIKSLPDTGVLKLGVDKVLVGTRVLKSDVRALRFIPYDGETKDTSFTFNTHGGFSDSDYTLTLCSDSSPAPVSNPLSLETYRAIPVFSTLSGKGDSLTFQILKNTKNGTLTLSADGSFVYTPKKDFVGKDSFEFCVKDACGKVSAPERVELRVRRPWRNLCFTDMVGSPYHFAAIEVCRLGIQEITYNPKGEPIFAGDEPLTRAEFVFWAMKASGEDLSSEKNDAESVFHGIGSTFPRYESAISAAVKLGVIRGRESDGVVSLALDEKITSAEAKTVISRLKKDDDSTDVFFSENEKGRTLTRGEGAALVLELLKDK